MSIDRDIDHLIKLIASVAEAFTAALFLPAEQGSHLSLAACHSLSPHIQYDCAIEVGSGLVGWVAANGEPVAVSDFKPETTTLGFYGAHEEIKSFLAVPVPLGEDRGVLAVDSKRSYVFPPRMQKLMTLFADHVGRLVHNSAVQALMLQTTSAIDQLGSVCGRLSEARSPSAVVEAALHCPPSLVGADGLAVALAEADGDGCRVVGTAGEAVPPCRGLVVSPKQSLAGWVIRNGKALALSDCREYYAKTFLFSPEEPYFGVRAFLGVPLSVGPEVLGVLAFTARRPGAFRGAEASTARLLAAQTSSALRAAAFAQRQWEFTYHDATTGLPNGRALREHGGGLLERAAAEGQPVACCVLALENLDAARLAAGPKAVAEALCWLAAHCRSLASEGTFVARDDEGRFVLVAPRLPERRAREMVERLLVGLVRMEFASPAGRFKLRATAGVAVGTEEAGGLEALVARAGQEAASMRTGADGIWQRAAVEEGSDGAF